ncbi:Protein tssc1, partial [Blyttiomyces sp. JEL0837]
DLDFNPNKSYYLSSCGDDGKVRIWDTRNLKEPLKEVGNHSHWVWSVSFNLFHDQLLLSSGSDCQVNLENLVSISSTPIGLMTSSDDEESDDGDNELLARKKVFPDGLVNTYREFEESVYTSAWSAADPWIFASLSYDGRVMINMVPRATKYSIIL